MKKILSTLMALSLLLSAVPMAAAGEGDIPTAMEAYKTMVALQEQYPERKPWTNVDSYTWKGGIEANGAGCVAFAYILSDAVFGAMPARKVTTFEFKDIKVGDVLKMNGGSHTVIVLQVFEDSVEVAEGNYHENGSEGFIHWGRVISASDLKKDTIYILTRYPENYVPADDPEANKVIAQGSCGDSVTWKLTNAGTLTVSGTGAMTDYDSEASCPWNAHMDKIMKIVVEDGVTSIGNYAFKKSSAYSISIPASVTRIGDSAFFETNIASIFLPKGVTHIGTSAFYGSQSLTTVNLPASITFLGSGAFTGCPKLRSVIFISGSQKLTMEDSVFTSCWELTNVTLPQNLENIGANTFMSCTSLPGLTIPSGVSRIENTAFSSCTNLAYLTIPATVTEQIGSGAFAACLNLKDIYYGGTEAQWNAISRIAMQGIKNVTVHYENTGPEQPTPPQGSLTKNDFTYTAPADLTYDGTEKTAKVEPKSGLSAAVGAVTVKYYKDGDIASPVNVGTYTVKIDVAASADYAAVTDLEVGSFTITAKALTGSLSIAASGEESTITRGTTLKATASANVDGTKDPLHYQWYRNGTAIEGAEGESYTLGEADVDGSQITVKAAAGSNYTGELSSDPVVVGKKILTARVALSVTGSGSAVTLTAAVTDADGTPIPYEDLAGMGLTLVWTRDGVAFANDKASYAVQDSDAGKALTVKLAPAAGSDYAGEAAADGSGSNLEHGVYTHPVQEPDQPVKPDRPGGSSSSGSSKPKPDPVTPTPSGDAQTQLKPSVSGDTASVSVKQETVDRLIASAADQNSKNIIVKVDAPDGVRQVQTQLPASAVAGLASKTQANLVIQTPAGKTTLPKATLAQLGAGSAPVSVTTTVGQDQSVTVEVQRGGAAVDALDGGMKLELPVGQPTPGMVAVLVDADGKQTVLPKSALNGGEMAVLLETGSATIKCMDKSQPFADTDGHWAKDAVAFVSSHALFQGVENDRFQADAPMNRAMLVTVLHRLESTPEAGSASFDDVPSDSYYAAAAAWAAGQGIVTGDGTGFAGERDVTREEMAVMLYRYVQTIHGSQGTQGSYDGMTGGDAVSDWAAPAMRWAVGSGILRGDETGNLNPGGTATRGQVAQMLMNFVQLITK